ncbi:MAG: T9SS type A sorting domain-containing protein [Ignavibacteria bacterium]|nr:T9SS type A sorting domain-containing protein [Ignavibacteria bacterium]
MNGRGYWVNFGSAQTLSYWGVPVTFLQVGVLAGWNMIGSLSQPLDVTKITSNPEGIVQYGYFGYQVGGYFVATQLEPGKGYWVMVSQNGQLNLNQSAFATGTLPETSEQPPHGPFPLPPGAPTLSGTIVNIGGVYRASLTWTSSGSNITYRLYRYICVGATDCLGDGVPTIPVYIGTALAYTDYDITVSAKLGNNRAYYFVTAFDIYGQSSPNSNKKIFATNDIINQKAAEGGTGNEGRAIPSTTTLGENYPNPFNPVTTIDYQLASPGVVTLRLYNILGEEVSRLVDGEEKDAGYYQVTWDGTSAASGIYFLRMSAIENTDNRFYNTVRKIVLMK